MFGVLDQTEELLLLGAMTLLPSRSMGMSDFSQHVFDPQMRLHRHKLGIHAHTQYKSGAFAMVYDAKTIKLSAVNLFFICCFFFNKIGLHTFDCKPVWCWDLCLSNLSNPGGIHEGI